MGISFLCLSNTTKINKWNFKSLDPKVVVLNFFHFVHISISIVIAMEFRFLMWKAKFTFGSLICWRKILHSLMFKFRHQCISLHMMSHTHFCPMFIILDIAQFKKKLFFTIASSVYNQTCLCSSKVFLKDLLRCVTYLQQFDNPYFQLITNEGCRILTLVLLLF